MDPLDFNLRDWLLQIQKAWGLNPTQLAALTHVSPTVFSSWVSADQNFDATVPPGMETAVPLISIYKRLTAQYSDPDDQVKWLFTEHADFAGSKPIDIISSSLENLYWVGYYLESSAQKPPAESAQ